MLGRRRTFQLAAGASAYWGLGAPAWAVNPPPHAFGPEAIKYVSPAMRILRIAGKPRSTQTAASPHTYAEYPISDAAFHPWDNGGTMNTTINAWEYLGDDRANLGHNARGSWSSAPIVHTDGHGSNVYFTTWGRSIASGLAKTAFTAGLLPRNDPHHPDHKGWLDLIEDWWDGTPIDLSAWDALYRSNPNDPVFTGGSRANLGQCSPWGYYKANADTVFANFDNKAKDIRARRDRYTYDRIVMNPGRLCDQLVPTGILYDAERFDAIPPAMFERVCAERAKILHCKGLVFALSGPGPTGRGNQGLLCGFTPENGNRIITNSLDLGFIGAVPRIPGGNMLQFLTDQLNGWKGPNGRLPIPPKKIGILVGIGGPNAEMTRSDASIVHQFLVDHDLWGYQIVPLYAALGGAPTNEPNEVQSRLFGFTPGTYVG